MSFTERGFNLMRCADDIHLSRAGAWLRLIRLGVLALAFAPAVLMAEPADAVNDPERLVFTEKDLPRDERGSEISDFARRRGFSYAKVARAAARGDAKALKQFFAMAEEVDGAAAESYSGMPTVVFHLLGDEKFAQFLKTQPLAFRMRIRGSIASDGSIYLRHHFPQTTRILFQREMVDWPSPDKRFAIHKVFSDEFNLRGSKVERAELIDAKNGLVMCDLTSDDIGVDVEREGKVIWSPDSKRFAYRSSDLTEHQGNLFSTPRPPPHRKQTVVYQLSGTSFTRVELNFSDVPGRENDEELKGAILGHDYIEPVRWEKPNVLLLERHEYYEKMKPTEIEGVKFDSIGTLARWYRITATIALDGKAAQVWKPRKQ